jgi:hypothetical protein
VLEPVPRYRTIVEVQARNDASWPARAASPPQEEGMDDSEIIAVAARHVEPFMIAPAGALSVVSRRSAW